MNPRVKKVEPNSDYSLTITFDNGEVKTFDLQPLLEKGVFKTLKDRSVFTQVKVSQGTITWPGEIDICPDTLYEEGSKV